jgi:hypothetical protein
MGKQKILFPLVHFKTSPSFSPALGRFAHEHHNGQTNIFCSPAAEALFSFRDEKEDTISGFSVDEGLVLNL